MAKIEWHKDGERFYETGVDRGVLFPRQTSGVPWNGLISVAENSSGGDVEQLYFDGLKYYDFVAAEDFQASIQAFSAPPEFAGCDGTKQLSPGLFATQQPRYPFGFSYRSGVGNDLQGLGYGYKLHLVYNATAAPSTSSYESVGKNVEPGSKSWTVYTVPPRASTYKPTAHFVIESSKVEPEKLQALEDLIYGSDEVDAALPTQAAVIALLT